MKLKLLIVSILFISFGAIFFLKASPVSSQEKKSYFIRSFDGSTKIPVPEEIIANKDCKAYRKFVSSLVRPGFVPDNTCPWAKVEPIGRFTMSGVEFEVPREYLWLSKDAPDGKIDGLFLMMKYPSMKASSANGDQNYNINVSIETFFCENINNCDHIKWSTFRNYAGLKKKNSDGTIVFDDKYTPELIQVREDISLHEYEYRYGKNFLVRGDPIYPDYWLDCGPIKNSNFRCKTDFIYKEKFKIRYTFKRKALLSHHDDIRKGIIDKINQLIVKKGKKSDNI